MMTYLLNMKSHYYSSCGDSLLNMESHYFSSNDDSLLNKESHYYSSSADLLLNICSRINVPFQSANKSIIFMATQMFIF